MSGITGMKGGFGQLAAGIGVAGIAFGVITTQMMKAVDVTTSYAGEVRQLSSITNQSAEQTSRMIQVMDDFALSSEQAGQAARFLAKEGMSLNIETIAKLSDQYKALNTGQARAEFLMKNFGKAGQDFSLIMDQGSDVILKQSGAISDHLILSKKDLENAEKLRVAQDNINDAKEAWYVLVGTKIIPMYADLVQVTADAAAGEAEYTKSIREGAAADELKARAARLKMDAATANYAAMTGAIEMLRGQAKTTDDVIRGLSDAEQSFLTSTQEMTPRAVAEFVTLQTKIAEVKRMIASGASFNVIVNFLAGKTIMVDPGSMAPGQNPGAPAKKTTQPTNKRASGGMLGNGWTMVGEQGFELIDPSGMVHSNPDSKKLIKAGVTPFKKLLTGGELGGDPYHWPKPSGGYNFSDDAAMMGMPGIPQNWIDNYNSKTGGKSSGSSAVIQTAAAASQSASQAAQQTSRAVDVTAQMSTQMASSSAAQMASLASIDRRLASLPSQLRDVFQQIIQQ